MLWVTLDYNETSVTIATSHFESMNYNAPTRLLQAQKVHELLGEIPNVLFLGDLNVEDINELGPLHEYWKESPNYNNTWFLQRLRPSEDDLRKQYDRVFMSPNWTLSNPAEIITSLVSEYLTKENVWTSDHDGLLVTIKFFL